MAKYMRKSDVGNKEAIIYDGEEHNGPPEILETAWGPVAVMEGCFVFTSTNADKGSEEKFVVHPVDLESLWQIAPNK